MLKKPTLLFVLLLSCFFSSVQAQTVTVILTRHAEKATNDPKDPDLSETGKARAEHLAVVLANQPVDLFFSTPYKRTRQTLEPLAKLKGKTITDYNPALGPGLVETVAGMENKTVVIAGHSNSIPDLVNGFLKTKTYSQIDDARYGDVWIVTLQKGLPVSVVQLKL